MTDLYLIRHSQIQKDMIENINEIPNEMLILSVIGEQKAKELSEHIALKKVQDVYTSPYARAVATAKYIADQNHIKIHVDSRLGERKIGVPSNGMLFDEFWEKQLIDESFHFIQGESRKMVTKRMNEAIHSIVTKNPQKTIAVITHGMAIISYLMQWCQLVKWDKMTKERTIIFQENMILQVKLHAPNIFHIVLNENNEPVTIQRVVI